MIPASRDESVSWRKSSRSASNGNCVEVADQVGAVLVRDSKDPDGPVLTFPATAWGELMGAVRRGCFDPVE